MQDSLLERDAEMQVLEAALADLGTGRSGVVVLEAPAGLGKTALLRAVRERAAARGFRILSARGAQFEQDFAFGVVRQLFGLVISQGGPSRRRLFGGPASVAEGVFSDVPADASSPAARTQVSIHLVLDALYWLTVSVAAPTGVVVLVDDTQWADEPSMRFLGFLARRIDSLAATIVVASRSGRRVHDESVDEIVDIGYARLLEPRALSPAAAQELVQQAFGPHASADFAAVCHATTGGNPLFLRELIRVLTSVGARPDAAGAKRARAAGPDAVRRHVVSSLRRHPGSVRSLAQAVAVLGDDIPLGLAARACDLSPAAAARAAELLVGDAVFEQADPPGFAHPTIRDVVLSSVPLAWREDCVQRGVGVLAESGAPAMRVAAQLLRTAPTGKPERVAVLLEAAEQARRLGSPASARVFLQRARDEPPVRELLAEVTRRLGVCEAIGPTLRDADCTLRDALALAEAGPQRAMCAYALARLLIACGAPGEAVDLLTGALRDLAEAGLAEADLGGTGAGEPGTDDRNLGDLALRVAIERVGAARLDLRRRQDLLHHLAALRRRPGAPEPEIQAQLALEAVFEGKPADDTTSLAQRALSGAGLPPDRPAFWVALQVLIVADSLDEAETHLRRVLKTATRRGLPLPTALTHACLGRVAYLRGDVAMAREHLDAGAASAVPSSAVVPVLQATQIELLLEAGEIARAEALVEDGPLADGRPPGSAADLWLLGARTQVRLVLGDYSAALEDADLCGRLYRQWGAELMLDVPWRLQAAAAALRLRDPGRAAHLADEHLRLARAARVRRQTGLALRTAAEVRGWDTSMLSEAIGYLDGTPARLELALTLERFGTALIGSGQHGKGLAALRRAARLAVRCRARATANRLSLALDQHGKHPAEPPESGPHALTPAELRIARLAGGGLSNRQIAERLYLSVKTIETHLSHVYRKLDVTSRTQLAIRLAESTRAE